MRISHLVLVVFLSCVSAFVTVKFLNRNSAGAQETAFERVVRTNTLRCGYYVFPPITSRDVKTQKLSGLSIDMMERIGQSSGLKIEWAEEVDFGTWPQGLRTGSSGSDPLPMFLSAFKNQALALTWKKVARLGRFHVRF